MQDLQTWIAVAGGVVALLGTVVAVTRYLTKVQEQVERQSLVEENRKLAEEADRLRSAEARLQEEIKVLGHAGGAALALKAELDDKLYKLMLLSGASGASIYVPLRAARGGEAHGLAFLSIEPFSPQTQALRSKLIPLKSIAGLCFTNGESFVVDDGSRSADHFKPAEKVSNYRPATMLNLALRHDGSVVGVLQLLARKGEAGFSSDDVARYEAMLADIPEKVAALGGNPEFLKALGIVEERAAPPGSVVYFDLSRSSLLFRDVPSSFPLRLLNDFFEAVCESAFQKGGALDTYMGDGALLRFTAPRCSHDHEWRAVSAALDMGRSFRELKKEWVEYSPSLAAIHFRAGIATGPLLRANLGHSSVQTLTTLGEAISVAAAMVQGADRGRDIILVAGETWRAAGDRLVGVPVADESLAKARSLTDTIHEVSGLR